MNSIDKIRALDAHFLELIKENETNIADEIQSSNMPLTVFELMKFVAQITSLKDGILNLVEERNFYCINLLHRGCIENFVKAFYLWLMSLRVHDDSFVRKYMEINSINEVYSLVHKKLKKCGLQRRELYTQLQANNLLFKKYSFDEFYRAKQEFTFSNILKKLSEDLDQKHIPVAFLHALLSKYDELSSFVHGGPRSAMETMSIFKHPEEARNEIFHNEIKNIVEISVLMPMHLLSLILIILLQNGKNKQIAKFYNDTNKIIKEIS